MDWRGCGFLLLGFAIGILTATIASAYLLPEHRFLYMAIVGLPGQVALILLARNAYKAR
jgi:hypothetical protein